MEERRVGSKPRWIGEEGTREGKKRETGIEDESGGETEGWDRKRKGMESGGGGGVGGWEQEKDMRNWTTKRRDVLGLVFSRVLEETS